MNCAIKVIIPRMVLWQKLHAFVTCKPSHLPIPLSLLASGTAQHDLPAAKQILEDHLVLKHGKLYADKVYVDAA